MVDMVEEKVKTVPVYTKIGWVLAWTTMVIIGVMILRNCATSVKYGSQTEAVTVESFYRQGLADGRKGNDFSLPAEVKGNPVLRKSYNKGYREGLDAQHLSKQ